MYATVTTGTVGARGCSANDDDDGREQQHAPAAMSELPAACVHDQRSATIAIGSYVPSAERSFTTRIDVNDLRVEQLGLRLKRRRLRSLGIRERDQSVTCIAAARCAPPRSQIDGSALIGRAPRARSARCAAIR